jgi:hypothetical protein
MAPPTTTLYFRVLHSYFSTDFGIAKLSPFRISQAQNNSIRNGVNIQDGDFTFIYLPL